jgi:alpha-beta hydrolase superfamily lysophospholipase
LGFLFGILAINLVAYLHARAFTHYARSGTTLAKPETLSVAQKLGVLLTGASHPRPINDRSPADVELEFATHFLTSDHLKLETWHLPCVNARMIVLLFHGHAASKSGLLNEAKIFHELGCECLLVDFRGGGGSTGETCTLGFAEAQDIAAAVSWVRERDPTIPIVLYGQSMGSAAILRATGVDRIQADALILECPFDRLLTTVQHRFEAMGFPDFPMARLLVFWGGVQHGFDAFEHNPVNYAQHVEIPTLIMHGGCDQRVRTSEAEAVASALTGPKSVHVFPDAGHEAYCSRCSEEWRELVRVFLKNQIK